MEQSVGMLDYPPTIHGCSIRGGHNDRSDFSHSSNKSTPHGAGYQRICSNAVRANVQQSKRGRASCLLWLEDVYQTDFAITVVAFNLQSELTFAAVPYHDNNGGHVDMGGLLLRTIPGPKLEPGRGEPAFGLAEAERRADQALAARSLLVPAGDSRGMSAAGWHCNAVSSSRSAPGPRAAS